MGQSLDFLSKHTARGKVEASMTTGVRFMWSPELWSWSDVSQTAGCARLHRGELETDETGWGTGNGAAVSASLKGTGITESWSVPTPHQLPPAALLQMSLLCLCQLSSVLLPKCWD